MSETREEYARPAAAWIEIWRRWCATLFVAVLSLHTSVAFAAIDSDQDGAPQWRWSGVERVVAVGDVHGAVEDLREILQMAELLGADGQQWVGGATHLVMLGDLLDRGPGGREAMDLVMSLQEQATVSGGRVHVLLGNHEVMNLLGDMRYVSPEGFAAFAAEENPKERDKALKRWCRDHDCGRRPDEAARAAFDKEFPKGYFARCRAFGPEGRYGAWLLDQHTLVVLNEVVYVHGGLAPVLLELPAEAVDHQGMAQLRTIVEARQKLLEAEVLHPETGYREQFEVAHQYHRHWRDKRLPRVQANAAAAGVVRRAGGALAVHPDGPLWYRGTSLNPADEEARLTAEILDHLGASRVVVGHTPVHTGRISLRLDGAVVMADTGMLASHYHGRASALVDYAGRLQALYPGEGLQPLPGAVDVAAESVVRASAEEIEEILRSAEVVAVEEVGSGSTRPQRVTLRTDGETYRAIFKITDAEREADEGHEDHWDRYQNEVAAYRVDQLLGLGMVPPTVLRRIDGVEGSLQLWVENAISENARRDEDLQPEESADLERQLQLVPIFDTLIHNPHRNTTNLLLTTHDWRLHLIDHGAAFGTSSAPPEIFAKTPLVLDLDVVNRLRRLEPEDLHQELAGLVSEAEIRALLERRERILAPWQAPAERRDAVESAHVADAAGS